MGKPLVMERSSVQSGPAAPCKALKSLQIEPTEDATTRHNPANVGGTRHVESWKSRGELGGAVPQPFPHVRPITHFVGFRDDRYWSAVRVWGRPHFIHRGFDLRARRDIDPSDTVVFAEGDADQAPRVRSYDDLLAAPPPHRPSASVSGVQGRV